MPGTVGVVANPVAGTDVRRLVASASGSSVGARVSTLRCIVAGALSAGASRVLVADDVRRIGRQAVTPHPAASVLELDVRGTRVDTSRAAELLRDEADVVVVVGGDGTHRDVALGWPGAPMVAVSSGTNNAFPAMVEPTTAGMAAGLVASGRVALDDPGVSRRAKVVRVGDDDLALVDCALVDDRFTGSRAVWDVDALQELVLAIAEPDRIGLSAIGGFAAPCGRHDDGGVHVRVAAEPGLALRGVVRVPLLPGRIEPVGLDEVRRLGDGEPVVLAGPGVLALDGERDRVLAAGDVVTVRVVRDGPQVIDCGSVLARWAAEGRALTAGSRSQPAPHGGRQKEGRRAG